MDQITDILAAEEVDLDTDQVGELMFEADRSIDQVGELTMDETECSQIDQTDLDMGGVQSEVLNAFAEPHYSKGNEDMSSPAAIQETEDEDPTFSHIDVVLTAEDTAPTNAVFSTAAPKDTAAEAKPMLGTSPAALSQHALRDISCGSTPSQLFSSTMSRIMRSEDPNFKDAEIRSRLTRSPSISLDLSEDGGSISRSMRSSFSESGSRRGSMIRRSSSVSIGADAISLGNMYSDSSSNAKRTVRRRSSGSKYAPQLRDILGSSKMTKNELFQDRSKEHWTSAQMLQKRNLERQCLSAFQTYVLSPLNEEDSNILNFESFQHFLQEIFCLPVNSESDSYKQVREVAYLTADALGGEKAQKLERSLKRLTREKLGLVALVPGVTLAGCMLMVLIANGLYKFDDTELNKIISDLRLAKLQNKVIVYFQ